MAIKAAPGYGGSGWNYGGSSYKPLPAAPKPAPIRASAVPTVGYTGSGWNYPLGNTGSMASYAPSGSSFSSVPAAAAPPPPSSNPVAAAANPPGVLGFNPYVGEIESDPMYGLGLAQRNASVNALEAARRTANQQAVIASGYGTGELNPASLGEYAGDINAETNAAAAANQFSTKAQLVKGLGQQMAAMPYDLARRGATRSGAAQTHATSYNEAFQSSSNQAMQSLAQQLSGNQNDYLTGRSTAEANWMAAQQDISSRLAQIYGYNQAANAQGQYADTSLGSLGGSADAYAPDFGGLGDVNGIVAPRLTPAVRTALVSPNAATRAKAAASAGFISPTPNVKIPAVSKAIAAVRGKK
jgi:hypothetical protein